MGQRSLSGIIPIDSQAQGKDDRQDAAGNGGDGRHEPDSVQAESAGGRCDVPEDVAVNPIGSSSFEFWASRPQKQLVSRTRWSFCPFRPQIRAQMRMRSSEKAISRCRKPHTFQGLPEGF